MTISDHWQPVGISRHKNSDRQAFHNFWLILAISWYFTNSPVTMWLVWLIMKLCLTTNCVHLHYNKLCIENAQWWPQEKRIASALEFVMWYKSHGDLFLSRIVTYNEMWIDACHLRTNNSQWDGYTQNLQEAKISSRCSWTVRPWGLPVLLVEFMPQGTTITATSSCQTTAKSEAHDSKQMAQRT